MAEYTNDKGRLHLYMAGWVWWVLGIATLSVIAWLTADWFSYGIITCVINIVILPFWW